MENGQKKYFSRHHEIVNGIPVYDSISIGEEFEVDEMKEPKRNGLSKSLNELVGGEKITREKIDLPAAKNLLEKTFIGMVLLAITITVSVLSQRLFEGGVEFSNLIYDYGIVVYGLFVIILTVSLFLMLKPRQLVMTIKGENLIVKSFPRLIHQIKLEDVVKCRLNIIKPNESKTNQDSKIKMNKIKVDAASGIAVYLRNGRCLVFGSNYKIKSD